MTQTLHRPPPLALTLGWRARGRKRRQRREENPHWTARGDCWTAPAANAGLCRTTRPSGAPIGSQDNIATTDGATSAPTSRLCAWRWNTRLQTRGGRESENGAAQRAVPLLPEALRKELQQAATTKMTVTMTKATSEGTPEEREKGEGPAEDIPGYAPTREDRRIKEVYGDWVHSNDGTNLSWGVKADQE